MYKVVVTDPTGKPTPAANFTIEEFPTFENGFHCFKLKNGKVLRVLPGNSCTILITDEEVQKFG